VHLREIDASIAQEIRYAGSDNFIGSPLAGYEAAECILRREVALALAQVQADLAGSGLSLKVYDCYRPERAVRQMVRWVSDDRAGDAGKRFYPRIDKRELLNGYISAHSRHSSGIAVDLTLVAKEAGVGGAAANAAGDCTARRDKDSVDMGTSYDCLDVRSETQSPEVGSEQRRWRNLLVAAMRKRGFANYQREWWHFSYPAAAAAAEPQDFPIRR
jgi:zinc D-Ala-D-Ala dipeptidase